MNLLWLGLCRAHGRQWVRGASAPLTACFAGAFALALGACAQHGLDDVKPTATTAYRTAPPAAAQQSPPARQP